MKMNETSRKRTVANAQSQQHVFSSSIVHWRANQWRLLPIYAHIVHIWAKLFAIQKAKPSLPGYSFYKLSDTKIHWKWEARYIFHKTNVKTNFRRKKSVFKISPCLFFFSQVPEKRWECCVGHWQFSQLRKNKYLRLISLSSRGKFFHCDWTSSLSNSKSNAGGRASRFIRTFQYKSYKLTFPTCSLSFWYDVHRVGI